MVAEILNNIKYPIAYNICRRLSLVIFTTCFIDLFFFCFFAFFFARTLREKLQQVIDAAIGQCRDCLGTARDERQSVDVLSLQFRLKRYTHGNFSILEVVVAPKYLGFP